MASGASSPIFKDTDFFTMDDYQRLFEEQGGCCAICRKHPPSNRRLAIDHCHKGYFVRGLLCSRCNLGIGFLEDDSVRDEALKYLRRATEFARKPKKLVMVDVNDFIKMKLPPKDDWHKCLDLHRREVLLFSEVERLLYKDKKDKKAIAKELGISLRRVNRLIAGNLR